MSEDGQGEAQTAADGVTAGTLLRQAREAAGLHVAALAVSLKVPVRKLEALENDRLDLLPDAVFVRALASSVCRTLKIDPQPVLDLLPRTARPRLIQDHDGINAPFRAPSDGAGPSWRDQMSKPVFLAVFALLLGALVLIFLPATGSDDSETVARTDAVAAPVPVVIPAAEPVPTQVAAASATPAAMSPTISTPRLVSPTAIVTPSPALARAVASSPATAASAPAPAGTVVFHTTGPSWVKVTDAKGVVTLQRLLQAGESAGASGALPLAVTVGSASTTQIQVRGQPFDLSKVSVVDNVARFEVK